LIDQLLSLLPNLSTTFLTQSPNLCSAFNDVRVEHARRILGREGSPAPCPPPSPFEECVAMPFHFRTCLLDLRGVYLVVLAASILARRVSIALRPIRFHSNASRHFDVTGKNC
jgi:hypothetical protein